MCPALSRNVEAPPYAGRVTVAWTKTARRDRRRWVKLEDEMLEGVAATRAANSQLSCQLLMPGGWETLVVRILDRTFYLAHR
jgi:hypothetical protein